MARSMAYLVVFNLNTTVFRMFKWGICFLMFAIVRQYLDMIWICIYCEVLEL